MCVDFQSKWTTLNFSAQICPKMDLGLETEKSNELDGGGWRLKWAGLSWVEVEMSWMEVGGGWNELGGGGWSWVEAGARFSNIRSTYILKLKFWLLEDQICSPEKYSMKNSHNKNIFYLNENIFWYHEKEVDIMKIYFIEYKFVLIECKYILISWKKGDIMKLYFIKIDWIKMYFHIIWIFIFETFQ